MSAPSIPASVNPRLLIARVAGELAAEGTPVEGASLLGAILARLGSRFRKAEHRAAVAHLTPADHVNSTNVRGWAAANGAVTITPQQILVGEVRIELGDLVLMASGNLGVVVAASQPRLNRDVFFTSVALWGGLPVKSPHTLTVAAAFFRLPEPPPPAASGSRAAQLARTSAAPGLRALGLAAALLACFCFSPAGMMRAGAGNPPPPLPSTQNQSGGTGGGMAAAAPVLPRVFVRDPFHPKPSESAGISKPILAEVSLGEGVAGIGGLAFLGGILAFLAQYRGERKSVVDEAVAAALAAHAKQSAEQSKEHHIGGQPIGVQESHPCVERPDFEKHKTDVWEVINGIRRDVGEIKSAVSSLQSTREANGQRVSELGEEITGLRDQNHKEFGDVSKELGRLSGLVETLLRKRA